MIINLDKMLQKERIAKSKNHQYLELLVWETDKSAIRLYEKNNFTPIARRMVKKLQYKIMIYMRKLTVLILIQFLIIALRVKSIIFYRY